MPLDGLVYKHKERQKRRQKETPNYLNVITPRWRAQCLSSYCCLVTVVHEDANAWAYMKFSPARKRSLNTLMSANASDKYSYTRVQPTGRGNYVMLHARGCTQ